MLRCIQVGIRIQDLDVLSYGTVIDILTEAGNDGAEYRAVASQADFDNF